MPSSWRVQKTSRKAINEKFLKRKKSLLKKGNELKQLCEADVYILLHHHGRYYIYTSTEQLSWPPNPDNIVSSFF